MVRERETKKGEKKVNREGESEWREKGKEGEGERK